jgi:hypothetical protein
MKKVIRWIILVWCILAIPYTFEASDVQTFFFEVLFLGLISGLMISDLREEKR